MKYFFILLYFSFFILNAKGQNTTFAPSSKSLKQYKQDKYHVMYYLHQDGELLVIHRSKKTLLLEKFNSKTMESIQTNEVEDFSKTYCIFERLLSINRRHFLLYSSYDKKTKKDRLLCREIDFELGNFKSTERVIVEVEGEIPMDDKSLIDAEFKHIFNHSFNPNRYHFEFSKNNTSILISHKTKRKKRKNSENKEVIGLYVFNNQLEKQWGTVIELPYVKTEMRVLDYDIDSKQNGYVFLQKNDRTLELLQYNNNELLETIPLSGFTKYIYHSEILEKQEGELILTGLTTNKEKGNNPASLYFFNVTIGKEKPLSNLNTKSIPSSLKSQCNSQDPKDVFLNLNLKECFLQEDGSLILIGEAQQGSYSYNGINEKSNILITKLSSDGSYKWLKAIPKRQTLYAGYKYQNINGKHAILFVDDIANHKKNSDPSIFGFEKGRYMAVCYVDDEDGRINKEIYIAPESAYCPTASNIHFISNNEFVFWGWKFSSQGSMSSYNKIPIGFPMSPLPNSAKPKSIVKGTFSK